MSGTSESLRKKVCPFPVVVHLRLRVLITVLCSNHCFAYYSLRGHFFFLSSHSSVHFVVKDVRPTMSAMESGPDARRTRTAQVEPGKNLTALSLSFHAMSSHSII